MQPESYQQVVKRILKDGDNYGPRGLMTVEVINTSYSLQVGYTCERPGINYKIGWVEGLAILIGQDSKPWLKDVVSEPVLDMFGPSTDYGLRVQDLVHRVIGTLKVDRSSRRAIAVIARHNDLADSKPCTMTAQWLIRGHSLDCIVNMRSQDLIKGLPYDHMMWSMVTFVLGNILQVFPGFVHFQVGSAHIYERDLPLKPFKPMRKYVYDENLQRSGSIINSLRDIKEREPQGWTWIS